MFRSRHVLECDKKRCCGGNYIFKDTCLDKGIYILWLHGEVYWGITAKLDLRVSGKVAAPEAGKVSKDQLMEAEPSLPR